MCLWWVMWGGAGRLLEWIGVGCIGGDVMCLWWVLWGGAGRLLEWIGVGCIRGDVMCLWWVLWYWRGPIRYRSGCCGFRVGR